jgi:hypothetical protein
MIFTIEEPISSPIAGFPRAISFRLSSRSLAQYA